MCAPLPRRWPLACPTGWEHGAGHDADQASAPRRSAYQSQAAHSEGGSKIRLKRDVLRRGVMRQIAEFSRGIEHADARVGLGEARLFNARSRRPMLGAPDALHASCHTTVSWCARDRRVSTSHTSVNVISLTGRTLRPTASTRSVQDCLTFRRMAPTRPSSPAARTATEAGSGTVA